MSVGSRQSLRALQQWMQSTIMHPGGVVAGAETAPEVIGIEKVIGRSRALSAIERLEIYNRSYFARLLDCMRAEYSVLAAALGEELFDRFALGYLQQYPSRSYTLGDLGKWFPEYLAETRPSGAIAEKEAIDHAADQATRGNSSSDELDIRPTEGEWEGESDWPEFMIDLARLERTINVVFDGPGAEGKNLLDHNRLAAISPERWPGIQLECVPCLKLLALSYPIDNYFTAVRRGEQTEIPQRSAAFLAVTRRDYRVERHPLGEVSYRLLDVLLRGEPVGVAISQAATQSRVSDDEFALELRRWFFQWVASGFFLDAH